jgi:CubicO group peptidase (beta-lactamase class C family)
MFHALSHARGRAVALTCAVIVLLAWPIPAATPRAKPGEVGLSSERLRRVGEAMQRHIQGAQIGSAVTLVARRGRIAHLEAFGQLDVESRKPTETDSLFRIASMSKPITGVAILMLLEEGKVRLNDPVSRFIPEFKSLQVSSDGAPPVPPKRDITVGDLLTHTSGLVSGSANAEIAKTLAGMALLPDTTRPRETLERYLPRIAAFPLSFQPGERYSYSPLAAFDALGRIVEVASGQTFDRFLKTRLFDPLDMTNTSFTMWREQPHRIALIYRRAPGGIERFANQEQLVSDVYFSGGAGLVSTAEDYFKFAQMLLDRGRANGRVLLSPTTVDLMIAPHAPDTLPGSTRGGDFGLSVQVMRDPLALGQRVSSGSFGWGGAYGTNFWIDPQEKLIGVLMIQMQGGSAETRRDFQTAVMQAIVE